LPICTVCLLILAGVPGCTFFPRNWRLQTDVYAYCPCERCCGLWADGKTSWRGRDAFKPGLAVPDKGPVRFGDRVYVPGYGEIVADDRSGSDVFEVRFPEHQTALNWGIKYGLEIYWLKKAQDGHEKPFPVTPTYK